MPLRIETFSAVRGGNSFFKAITHPQIAAPAAALRRRLEAAGAVALYDPLGLAGGFAEIHDLSGVDIRASFVQAATDIGKTVLGRTAQPITELGAAEAGVLLVVAFDADRLLAPIRHLLPTGMEIVTLDSLRLPDAVLTNRRNYLDPLNFATNFAFFRDQGGHHSRLVTANYWSGYGAGNIALALMLFDGAGNELASWREEVPTGQAAIELDSRAIRTRFGLPEFTGQLFVHAIGATGHDVVKYALDTFSDPTEGMPLSLSCTHDANAWPADFYAGVPAPRDGEQVLLWVQNGQSRPIPAGEIGFNLMGDDRIAWLDRPIPAFATTAIDVAELLPRARWPEQIEIQAGRHFVRPRYEVVERGRVRIAHANVERTDLEPDPKLPELGKLLGKGFLLPAPILPTDRWRSVALPTPMARGQRELPIAALVYDAGGQEIARHRFGRLPRNHATALDLADILDGRRLAGGYGHMELIYDFTAGSEADGWLHGLFRYEDRATGHAAETSFGAHVFNTAIVYKDEPQSYSGRPPGLSTRLFLRLGHAPLDTLCHVVYPASIPWHPTSTTDFILHDRSGKEIARRRYAIACSGSLFWRYSDGFDAETRQTAGEGAYVIIRDTSCRLFGYHGLLGDGGTFSLDHMFGF